MIRYLLAITLNLTRRWEHLHEEMQEHDLFQLVDWGKLKFNRV